MEIPTWQIAHYYGNCRYFVVDFPTRCTASFPNGGWKNPRRVRKAQVLIFERNGILSELLEAIPGIGKQQYHFGAIHQICHHNQEYPNAVYGTLHMQHSGFVGSEY